MWISALTYHVVISFQMGDRHFYILPEEVLLPTQIAILNDMSAWSKLDNKLSIAVLDLIRQIYKLRMIRHFSTGGTSGVLSRQLHNHRPHRHFNNSSSISNSSSDINNTDNNGNVLLPQQLTR